MRSGRGDGHLRPPGSPIRKSSDHSLVADSPRLIAGSNVLHRLLMPRHPPCALSSLTNHYRHTSKKKMLASTVQFSRYGRAKAARPLAGGPAPGRSRRPQASRPSRRKNGRPCPQTPNSVLTRLPREEARSAPGPRGGQGVLAATSAAARLIASAPLGSMSTRPRARRPMMLSAP
jgi:hypothetical protein